ncbi:MAG: hypothetical protein K0S14_1420 [Thermomicrobiales bacterium]|nr:hypothetical protein [Thermomicrobiales bacterium]
MINICIGLHDDLTGAIATAEIPSEFGPALRSALEDLSNIIGERLVGVHKFEREDALTFAATAVGTLRAAVNQIVPEGHPDYE